jgi:hypothetical protein
LIRVPSRRLERKGGWLQLKIEGKKTLGWAIEGQTLLEKYRLTGNALLRVVTRDKTFDKEFKIDLEVEDIPF